jgi:hypothetical protein
MRKITLVLLALLASTAVLLAVACGGDENGPTPGAATSPASAGSPGPTPTRRASVAPARLCQVGKEPPASYNVQVKASWKGKDRVVIDGSATLPGGGTVNYWICQDGEVTASLVWDHQPTFENGKISAESKLVEAGAGPIFNPDAKFEVVIEVLGEKVQVPYFTIRVPVEGKPG